MPRSRLAWRWFAVWSLLVVGLLVVSQWIASVELARLADAMQMERMSERARNLSASLPDDPDGDRAWLEPFGRGTEGGAVEVFDVRGRPIGGGDSTDSDADGKGLDAATLADALAGRRSTAGRYDAASARRTVSVVSPVVRGGRTTAIIRINGDTTAADAGLAAAQRRLVTGALAGAAVAMLAGWLLARRAAGPFEDLASAASRLAAGAIAVPLPASDVAEVSALAGAIEILRGQLVERSLTIGRQGTQQEAVLGSMIEGVLAVDASQRIVSINRAAADLLGLDPATVLGRPIQEVVRNADLRQFALQAIDCRETVEDDLVLRAARDRTLRVRGTPLNDPSGEGGAVIVLNDITDIRHLENVRRDFVANVSHELKTPVASIKGFVETLLEGRVDDPADRRRFLEIIGRQSDRLGTIIDDLLALSRIEQAEGMGDLPLEQVPVADVLAAVVAECGPRADERSITIEVDSPPALGAEVNAPLLEQALINLVDNALKYSEPGGRVVVAVAPTVDGMLEWLVRDQGSGIGAEHLPRLFERFYRVDKGRSRRLGGTGLGLSIVKHIVQAHGGTVAVESTLGVGSTFRVFLPASRG
ncbi:MAG: PAS domain-containing protein [Planctomycetota bacterium]|nr:MAG: PAS domain-containing protein [Planctomycetota bacterium]